MKACFIGHRKIQVSEELISSLEQIVVDLIHKGVKTFLFGSMSEFDNISWSTVTKLKKLLLIICLIKRCLL